MFAWWYAQHGWPVFPVHSIDAAGFCTCGKSECRTPGKHPRIREWPKNATTDEATIRRWWRKWPDANIAAHTGPESGFFVVDGDPRSDADPLRQLQAEQGLLPETVEARTGRPGGRHLYFRYPTDRTVRSRNLREGIDIKGKGGYVMLPPSKHASGRTYEWVRSPAGIELADAPPWLLDQVCEKSELTNKSDIPEMIREGARNDTLMRLAGSMRRNGLSAEQMLPRLRQVNNDRCVPPLADEEVAQIARSAERYPAAPSTGTKDGRSQASRLVEIAERDFTLGLSTTGEPFAVKRDGPNLARMLRRSRNGLRAELAAQYFEENARAASSSALTDAMNVLEGRALHSDRVPLSLRIAEVDGDVVIDLGDASGRVVRIGSESWTIEDRSPVIFRRTGLTMPLPIPERGGSLDDLRRLVNLSDDAWALFLGYLVSCLFPGIPHPIAMLCGEHGGGKSTVARLMVRLVDPTVAETSAVPRDQTDWSVVAAGSWMIVLDNLSHVRDWTSDALCRAVTGEALVRRSLFTDDSLAILQYRRVVVLTTIDPGAIRGDLADRLVVFDLQRIPDDQRLDEQEIEHLFWEQHARFLGALYDLAAKVRAELPKVQLTHRPRMADFSNVLAALDRVLGTNALGTYLRQRNRLAEDVIESDAVAITVLEFAERNGTWSGTAQDLLSALVAPDPTPRDWPRNPKALSSRIRRLVPALRQVGVEVTPPSDNRRGPGGKRVWRIDAAVEEPSQPSQPSTNDGTFDVQSRPISECVGEEHTQHCDCVVFAQPRRRRRPRPSNSAVRSGRAGRAVESRTVRRHRGNREN